MERNNTSGQWWLPEFTYNMRYICHFCFVYYSANSGEGDKERMGRQTFVWSIEPGLRDLKCLCIWAHNYVLVITSPPVFNALDRSLSSRSFLLSFTWVSRFINSPHELEHLYVNHIYTYLCQLHAYSYPSTYVSFYVFQIRILERSMSTTTDLHLSLLKDLFRMSVSAYTEVRMYIHTLKWVYICTSCNTPSSAIAWIYVYAWCLRVHQCLRAECM